MPSEPLQLSGLSDSPWVSLVCKYMHTPLRERVFKRLGAPGKFQSPTGTLMHVTVEQVASARPSFPHPSLMCQCDVPCIHYGLLSLLPLCSTGMYLVICMPSFKRSDSCLFLKVPKSIRGFEVAFFDLIHTIHAMECQLTQAEPVKILVGAILIILLPTQVNLTNRPVVCCSMSLAPCTCTVSIAWQ